MMAISSSRFSSHTSRISITRPSGVAYTCRVSPRSTLGMGGESDDGPDEPLPISGEPIVNPMPMPMPIMACGGGGLGAGAVVARATEGAGGAGGAACCWGGAWGGWGGEGACAWGWGAACCRPLRPSADVKAFMKPPPPADARGSVVTEAAGAGPFSPNHVKGTTPAGRAGAAVTGVLAPAHRDKQPP
jgi:hypothetical protein